jgi:hypothetical protein
VPANLVQQLLQARQFKCPHCKVIQGLPQGIGQQQHAQLPGGYLPGNDAMQVSMFLPATGSLMSAGGPNLAWHAFVKNWQIACSACAKFAAWSK